ncbi:MAG: alanine--tRNA ligase [Candidatus Dasytiphilus stammeri]
MKYKNCADIRQDFLDFFHRKGHQIVESSSLIPKHDATLLFTNAGMNQFKDIFVGRERSIYSRVTTCQRCMRAGGKHNDLDKVGYTSCHHTFFEMLGNFSFGDYFKQEAIHFAWELLTSPQWFNLSKEKLWVTVYAPDKETYDIWHHEIGMPHSHIIGIGNNKGGSYCSDNFWQMGDIGPCGPCTEIFYDHGPHIKGALPGKTVSLTGNRYIELWNIVFMQYNKQPDGSFLPLPQLCVDTGMGLERIATVLQQVPTNYDIDIFRKLIKLISLVTNINLKLLNEEDSTIAALRVLADHIRSASFLIADGVLPSNEGRGYVLRHIIRRAVRHGYMIGIKEKFFYQLVSPLIETMDSLSEYIKNNQTLIEEVLKIEEETFMHTLEKGLSLLNTSLSKLHSPILDGQTVFRLYDTYGLPRELTAEICKERHIKIDEVGFQKAMDIQRNRSRLSSSKNKQITIINNLITIFKGYDQSNLEATVTSILIDGQRKNHIKDNTEDSLIILDQTPFYSESGGQIGDTGKLWSQDTEFIVTNTIKLGSSVGHIGKILKGSLCVGQKLIAQIHEDRRVQIALNHTATHLLHSTLRLILGNHVMQKGSLITDKYLRFDFNHFLDLEPEQLLAVEQHVNMQIRRNMPISAVVMGREAAHQKGALYLRDKQYPHSVRVLTIGDYSVELCNGTHANSTGEIGLFRIMSEYSVSSGIRRIEATTGHNALQQVHHEHESLQKICRMLRANNNNIYEKVHSLTKNIKILKKELQDTKAEQYSQESNLLMRELIKMKHTSLLVSQLINKDSKFLRAMVILLLQEVGSGVIILATVINNSIALISGVTQDLTPYIKANEIIEIMGPKLKAKGGGKEDIAQACGKNIKILPQVLEEIKIFLIKELSSY